MEADRARLLAVMVREAGKTLPNALSDLREAVDFLRYYASEARRQFAGAVELKGADRRAQPAVAARPRHLCGNLAVELPVRHLHWPGRRRACRRQRGAGKAG